MMSMFKKAYDDVDLDVTTALKHNFILNAMDGSEDYLVSDGLTDLVGEEIQKFRKELWSSDPPKNIEHLIKTITPPEGVKRKSTSEDTTLDEGRELLDCEGEEMDPSLVEELTSTEEVEQSTAFPASSNTSTSTTPCCNTTSMLNPIPGNSADAALLNEIQEALKKHAGETSRLLLPYVCQFTDTLNKARRMLKKRVATERPTLAQEGTPSDGILLHY